MKIKDWSRRHWVVAFIVMALLATAAVVLRLQLENAHSANLLYALQAMGQLKPSHGARVTDGRVARNGAAWDSKTSAVIPAGARLEYDLGTARQIGCMWVQADNNDHYIVEGSLDGHEYTPVWTAPPVTCAGLRMRYVELSTEARYLRLIPESGDNHYSVSEFGAAEKCPRHEPVGTRIAFWQGYVAQGEDRLLLLTAALVIAALLLSGTAPGWLTLPLSVLAVGSALMTAFLLYRSYPLFHAEPALRATIALVSAAIVIREAWGENEVRHQRRHTALLAVLAFLAAGCYFHFGALQFRDNSAGRQTFVHGFDMRHYFPLAKYFPELRFDGLYLASLAAYVDETGMPASALSDVNLRDLSTNEMRTAPEVAQQLDAVRARFSKSRWQEFRRDMRYFMDSMGRGYLDSMQDHGGNATPVWVLGAWLLFRSLPANEWILTLAGLIDPLLLAIMFVAIARCFGLRTMLLCAVLFGATDFYQFGSNLVGSTLRQDWLVALGLGACALKSGRLWLGGALLAYAGFVRAFPAVATFFLLVPVCWWLVDCMVHRTQPTLQRLWQAQRPALHTGIAAAVTALALVIASTAAFGWQDSWVNWYEKIRIHAVGPSVNNVGLRNVMSYDPELASRYLLRSDRPEPWVDWQRTQAETYAARRPVTYAILLLTLLLAFLAARGRPLHEVSLLGLLTIPFLFYPSNYYCHFIFLLPLAFGGGMRQWVFIVLAGLCAGQYLTLSEVWTDERYTYQSFLLLGTCWAILLPAAWLNRQKPHKPVEQPGQ